MSKTARFTRGEVSKLSGCNPETVRYYERIGILPPPRRSAGGHRIYDDAHLGRLNFVRRCRDLGFSLNEIRSLLSLVDGGDYTCADVKDITEGHLHGIRAKIADLTIIEAILQRMVAQCTGTEVPECRVIDALLERSERI